MKVDFDRGRFSVMATGQWGLGATCSHRQTRLPRRGQAHPGREGMLSVKRAQEQLSFFHEESDKGELDRRRRSPTTIMVPLRQQGQRLRLAPVIFSSKSLAD